MPSMASPHHRGPHPPSPGRPFLHHPVLLIAWVLLPALSAGAVGSAPAPALPFVSPIFGDNMVLQRGKPNTFWGWATPGETIRVEIDGRAGRCGRRRGRTLAGAGNAAARRHDCVVRIDGPQHVELPMPRRRRLALRRPVQHGVRPAPGAGRRPRGRCGQPPRHPPVPRRPVSGLRSGRRTIGNVEGVFPEAVTANAGFPRWLIFSAARSTPTPACRSA